MATGDPLTLPLTLGSEGNRWTVGTQGATMWTEWGKDGGKVQRNERHYSEGKQGRTASEQAAFEARSAARKKMRLGYSPLGAGASAPTPAPAQGTSVGGDTVAAATAATTSMTSEHPPLPMLATDWSKVKRPDRLLPGFFLQPKLDGIRCVADTQTGRLFSRTGKELTGLPHLGHSLRLAADVARPPARWVDGEIYRHGASFQGIVGAARRTVNIDPRQAEQLQLHCFDTVAPASADVRLQQLATWIEAARSLVSPGKLESLQLVHTERGPVCSTTEELRAALDAATDEFGARGYEGAIARVASAPYVPRKRSLDLVKAKRFVQEEFAVTGLQERPKQPGLVATVQCLTAGGVAFGATPECTTQEKRDMWERRHDYLDGSWVATVRFQELSDGGVPRFPVCAGLRHADDR